MAKLAKNNDRNLGLMVWREEIMDEAQVLQNNNDKLFESLVDKYLGFYMSSSCRWLTYPMMRQ